MHVPVKSQGKLESDQAVAQRAYCGSLKKAGLTAHHYNIVAMGLAIYFR